MFKKIDSLIQKWSSWISSSNIDMNTAKNRRWMITCVLGLPALVTLIILSIGVFPHLYTEKNVHNPMDFSVPLNQDEYLTSYEDFGDQQIQKSQDLLWAKQNFRRMLPHSSQLDQMHGQLYWIGIEISPERAQKALLLNANNFMLGQILGTWELYIDSTLVKTGGKLQSRHPVVISIPEDILKKKEGFKISARIRNDMEDFYPDVLFFTGFATELQLQKMNNSEDFDKLIFNSIAFGVNLALGLLFLSLWFCGMRKQELAALAAVGLLHAAIQGGRLPLVYYHMGALNWHRLNFVSTFYEAVIMIWLGLSISRIRSRSVLILLAILLIAPWFVFATSATTNDIFFYVWQMSRWSTPFSYVIAAAICFGQGRVVSSQHRLNLEDPSRILKLNLSSLAMLLMGLSIWHGNALYLDYRIFNTALIMVLSTIVVHEYRKQELFNRRSPISKYHQRIKLPEDVFCFLSTIDLKNSESLYRFSAEKGLGGTLIIEIISKFYDQIVKAGGEVIQTEGDSITFFFDTSDTKNNLNKILLLIQELNQILLNQHQLNVAKYGSEYPTEIFMRVAVEKGSIKPIWQNFEGRDVAGWLQASNSNVFVDVARLLEAESKLGNKSESTIVLSQGKEQLGEGFKIFKVHQDQVIIKHGRKINVSVISLGSFS